MKTALIIFPLVCALAASVPTARAQEDYTRRIEVTKRHDPRVMQQEKLYVSPRMTDSVRMQLPLEYSIGSVPWKTVFHARTLPPITISSVAYFPRRPFFIRAGGGWPARSILDVRYSPVVTRDGQVVLWTSYDSRYPRLRTDSGERLRAVRMRNAAGVRVERLFGRRRFTAETEYANLQYDAYGVFQAPGVVYEIPSDRRIVYNDVHAHLSFGDGFTDLDRFNFRVEADGGYFAEGSFGAQYEIGFSAEAGKEFSGHALRLEAAYAMTEGLSDISYYYNRRLEISPEWKTDWGIMEVKVGASVEIADVRYSPDGGKKHAKIFPDAELELSIAPGLNPYLQAKGGKYTGDYRSLAFRNPYLAGGQVAPDAHHWTYGGGLRGTLAGAVDYDLHAAYSVLENYFYFLNATASGQLGRFAVGWADVRLFSAGVDINAVLTRGLSLRVKALYLEDFKGPTASAYGLPRISGSVRLRYEASRFYIWAGGVFSGRTPCGILFDGEIRRETMRSSVDLGMGVGCNLKSGIGLFAEAGNLLDRRIYLFNHYPGERLNISAGISLAF